MVSTLVFDIDSPTTGQRFAAGQFFGVGGTALVENVGLPTFTITGVEVQFGAGGPIVAATRSGGGYSATGTPQIHNAIVDIIVRCHIRFLDGTGNSTATDVRQVVIGNLVPRVDIDPFDNDVTVTELPYLIQEVRGSTSEPFTTISNVRWRLDGGAPTPVTSVSGGQWRVLNLPVPTAGRHQLTIEATDPFGSTGSATIDVSVRVPVNPDDRDRVFAETSYLGELLGLAQRYVSVEGAPPGPSRADLEARLRQPLDALTKANAFRAATAEISQSRLAVEVLRGVIAPSTTTELDQRYRQLTYETLLEAMGVSFEELRLARTADDRQRQALAARLGLAADQLEAITLARADVTDEALQRLFGFQPTVRAPLEGPPPPTAEVRLAQEAALRRAWRTADDQATVPLILPDLVSDEDFVSDDPNAPARELWSERVDWRADQLALIRSEPPATRDLASFDKAVTDFAGGVDLVDLAARDEAGENIGPELEVVGMDKPALRRLIRLRRLLEAAETLEVVEWDEFDLHLLAASSRQQYPLWRSEEVTRGIILDPSVFRARNVGADLAPAGAEWRHTLAARSAQLANLASAFGRIVTDTERLVLPQLRDALVTEIGARRTDPEKFDESVDRLSRALSFDLRAEQDRRTTRVTQAVESLQEMLTTARSGSYRPELGVPVLHIANETAFDLEWEWLLTYTRWVSAMRAFAYPENQLHPQLFVNEVVGTNLKLEPTATYTAFLKLLSGLNQPSPDAVRDLVNTSYLQALPPAQRPAGLVLTERLDNAGLAALKTRCRQLVQAAEAGTAFTEENQIPQHLREIFWLVPVAAARKLQVAGHFVPALDWLQTVFAYQLPPASRPIYYGLVLEQATTSDYGRLPDWLAQVRELNPHFTARKRRGAYTRATALTVVECFLDNADSEFAQHTTDSRARALSLYQSAHDVLHLPEVLPEEGDTVPFPLNPVWQSLAGLATAGMAKVHAGLDIAGQPDLGLADSSNILPSQYRYNVLVERAKTLVGIAQQVEAAFLAALERADAENYALLQASRDLRVARSSLVAQDLRVDSAANGFAQTLVQRDRAQLQFSTYDQWIGAGLNDHEQSALDSLKIAGIMHATAAVARLMSFTTFWDSGDAIAGALAEGAAALSTKAQIDQTLAGFERREQEWKLARAVAGKDQQLAQVQIAGARIQHQLAEVERQIAADQLDHAQAVAEFLATKFTNAELFEWMSGVLGRVYAFFLQQATAQALLAQAQLAFERQEPVAGFIAADYWHATPDPGAGGQPATDRRGLTGSARLLQDIFQLDQHAFDTNRRKLHLTQTFALSQLAGYELQQLRQTGVLTFATPQELFDRQFPGHYLRLVNRVEMSLVALLPPTIGVHATLSASGVSRAVVARGGSFDTVTLRRDPESIAFTTPTNATGMFKLEPDNGLLLPFEGMGVDTIWQLELPKAANPFDYRTIAEVLLTIEYTALESQDHRQTVIRALDRRFSGDRSFSLRNEFPDAWYELNNPDTVEDPARRMRAVLNLTASDFPPHIQDLSVAQLTLFAVRDDALADELTVTALRHTIPGQTPTESTSVHTVGGIVSTRRPGGTAWQVLLDADPAGDWEIQLQDTPAVRAWFAGGLVQDLVLVFSLSGTTPAWT